MNSRFALALVGTAALAATAGAQSFSYPDFSSMTGINVVGLATQAGTVLQLQNNVAPAVGSDNRGAAWYATPVNVVNGFDTTFTFRMHDWSTTNGSDGFAFVIQNDLIAGSTPIVNGAPDGVGGTAIGRHAAAMGYGNFATSPVGDTIDNSVAIEFDTTLGTTWGDPDSNHISIHTGGSGDNGTHESFSIGRALNAAIGFDMNSATGTAHTARVVYTPGSPGTLDVYLDGNLKLSAPYSFVTGGTWVDSGTPVGGLNLIGGTSAYVGFTSGAGTAREFRDIQSWDWASGGPTPTAYCFGDGSGTACPCGNAGAAGNGCASSVNANGGNLAVSGSATLAGDTLVLTGSGMPNSSALYFQGTNQMNGGMGTVFGDGLRCAGGTIIRLGTKTNVAGTSQYPAAGDPSVSVRGAIGVAGTRTYQVWYRNAAAFCTSDTFNLTNAVEVPWS